MKSVAQNTPKIKYTVAAESLSNPKPIKSIPSKHKINQSRYPIVLYLSNMKDEILDQPIDEGKNETSFLQSSTGINPRIIGSARLAILMVVGFFLFISFGSGGVGLKFIEKVIILFMFLSLVVTSLYYIPQSFLESKRRPAMFAKNRLRKVSLLLPIMTIFLGIYLSIINFAGDVFNPILGLNIGLFLICSLVIYRDIKYIRLNR